MKNVLLLALLLFFSKAQAQIGRDEQLFKDLKAQDSVFFERGFNLCDISYLESHITADLRFFHDQGGIQNRSIFLENVQKYICIQAGPKPIRKIEEGSLEVFPLYQNGELYGAIQKGVHHFYLRENGKADVHTSTAKFTHVWILVEGAWKLTEVLSYDHQTP
jgi:hypothetical protein